MKFFTNKTRGFTLIELLVVIAIIGMLAAVVLASLNSARNKGADAAKKSNLNNIRSQAAIVYDTADPDSYAAVCADTNVANAIAEANGSCADDAAVWAAEAVLSDAATYYCVDSTGYAGDITGSTITEGSDYACN